jgi:hypothetical protein
MLSCLLIRYQHLRPVQDAGAQEVDQLCHFPGRRQADNLHHHREVKVTISDSSHVKGSQGQATVVEGPCEDAHQGAQHHHQDVRVCGKGDLFCLSGGSHLLGGSSM